MPAPRAVGARREPFLQNLGNEGIEWDDNENGFWLTAPWISLELE